jgi:2-iminobutanoate/2-iminopropanoate deaminase
MADPRLHVVHTATAPAAIGPYSQAVVANGVVYTAGQIALDPATMQIVEGDVVAQAEQVMNNLTEVLAAAGASWASVVKTTIFLADMADFQRVNEVYARRLGEARPARSTVAVAGAAAQRAGRDRGGRARRLTDLRRPAAQADAALRTRFHRRTRRCVRRSGGARGCAGGRSRSGAPGACRAADVARGASSGPA